MGTLTNQKSGGQVASDLRDDKKIIVPNRFTRAAKEHVEPFADNSVQMAAGPVQVGPLDVISFGYLRHIVLQVTTSGGVGGAATVAAKEDAPWSALRDITLSDVNGAPIVGPLSGYDLYLANKYGAYTFDTDPANTPNFSAVAVGAGATGHFTFQLRVPVEIAGRDALGALPNMNAASTYKLSYSVAGSADVYSTAPATTLPTVRVRAWIEAWTQPQGADLRGLPNEQRPPAEGTSQYWTKQVVNINAGDQRIRLTRMGNLIRNLIFIQRNATPVRSTTDFPDPVRIEWDGKIKDNIGRDVLRNQVRERYGFAGDTGVFVWEFTHDLDYRPGNEMRDLYLATTQATRMELVGNFANAGTLTILTNDVAPAADIFTEA